MFYFVSESGICENLPVISGEKLRKPYRLFRFLTDLENLLEQEQDDYKRLQAICPLVVHLLQSSLWLQLPELEPEPELGWAVQTLYEEPFFPLTVQLVAWRAGEVSPIHNHGAWGLVAVIQGQEKNSFWRRQPTSEFPDRIIPVGDHLIEEGQIITFSASAIHSVEITGSETAISLNLYGATQYDRRWQFDPIQHRAELF